MLLVLPLHLMMCDMATTNFSWSVTNTLRLALGLLFISAMQMLYAILLLTQIVCAIVVGKPKMRIFSIYMPHAGYPFSELEHMMDLDMDLISKAYHLLSML